MKAVVWAPSLEQLHVHCFMRGHTSGTATAGLYQSGKKLVGDLYDVSSARNGVAHLVTPRGLCVPSTTNTIFFVGYL